jgi:hypothetical protein
MAEANNSVGSNAEATENLWLVAFGLSIPLALILLAASPLGTNFIYVMLGIPALLLVWVMIGITSLTLSIRSAMKKAWRRSLIASVLPIILPFIAVNPFEFIQSCNYIGDVLHFIVLRPYYEQVITDLPRNERPHLVVFNWGGMVWASRGLVYDETDQISLPPDRQSTNWLAQAKHSELSCEGYSAHPLWAHYYLVSFTC